MHLFSFFCIGITKCKTHRGQKNNKKTPEDRFINISGKNVVNDVAGDRFKMVVEVLVE